MSVAHFPAGYAIPRHYHAWGCVSLILRGRFLQRFPGRECECPAGYALAKPPGECHEDRWGTVPSRHLIIEVDPSCHAELGGSRAIVERIHHLRADGTEPFTRRIAAELARPDDLTPVAVQGLTLELLALLARRQRATVAGGGPRSVPGWLRQTRDYLEEHFREPIRLPAVAALAGVHPDHLARRFTAAYGQGIGEYVRGLRLEAAMVALATTRDSIASIAARSGFSDQSHLTRLLRQNAGLTPRVYRAAQARTAQRAREAPGR